MLWWRVRVWLFQLIWATWGLLGITGIERALLWYANNWITRFKLQVCWRLSTDGRNNLSKEVLQRTLWRSVVLWFQRRWGCREAPSFGQSIFWPASPYGLGQRNAEALVGESNGMAANKANPKKSSTGIIHSVKGFLIKQLSLLIFHSTDTDEAMMKLRTLLKPEPRSPNNQLSQIIKIKDSCVMSRRKRWTYGCL